jgi:hypothetical protein
VSLISSGSSVISANPNMFPHSWRLLFMLGALFSLFGCSSNHHVSPYASTWNLSQLLQPRLDLPTQLDAVSKETKALGLTEVRRLEKKLPGQQPFVILAFQGTNAVGNPIHAVRVVTPASVVLALGPPGMTYSDPTKPTELLEFLVGGQAYESGSDFNGDRMPDVAIRSENGSLHIFRIELQGANEYPISMVLPATEADDWNQDGYPDMIGTQVIPVGDPIAPIWKDIAIATRQGYSDNHPDATRFHNQHMKERQPSSKAARTQRLRFAFERSFHQIRAGVEAKTANQALADLEHELTPLNEELASSFGYWRAELTKIIVKMATMRANRPPVTQPVP